MRQKAIAEYIGVHGTLRGIEHRECLLCSGGNANFCPIQAAVPARRLGKAYLPNNAQRYWMLPDLKRRWAWWDGSPTYSLIRSINI